MMMLSSFSQEGDSVYRSSLLLYHHSQYKDALQGFKAASNSFVECNNIQAYLKSQLYISKIEAYKNNFQAALQTINQSLKTHTASGIENDSLWNALMNTKTAIYRLEGKNTKALQINDQLMLLADDNVLPHSLIQIYIERSRILVLLNNPDESIAIIKKTMRLYEDILEPLEKAMLYDNLGNAYVYKDDFDQAEMYYQKAHGLAIKYKAKLEDLSSSSFHLGIIAEYDGNYNKAIEWYKKSAQYIQQNQVEETILIARTYTALSNAYLHKNNIERAKEYIDKALQKSLLLFDKDHFNMAHIYSSYSRILKASEKFEESLIFDKKTQHIRENIYGLYNRFSIQNLKSIARTNVELGNYAEALKLYNEILRRTKKMGAKLQQAHSYNDLGTMYHKKKEYQKAIFYFEKGHKCLSTEVDTYDRQMISMELSLAATFFEMKDYPTALKIIEKHFRIHTKISSQHPKLILQAIDIYNNISLATYQSTGDIDILHASYKKIPLLLNCIASIKKEYTRQSSQINANNEQTIYFDKSIEVCYFLYQKTKEHQYLAKAFELSEMNRNSVLVSGIKNVRFKKIANIPDSLLLQENQLKQKLSKVKRKMYNATISSKTDTLISLRLQYAEQLDSLLSNFKQKYPKYYQLKYADKTISISSLQSKYLTKNTVFVEYYVGADYTYVFEIHKGKTSFRRLEINEIIRKKIKEFRSKLIKQQDVTITAKILFDVLLKTCNLKKNIIIVADDVLNYLPFEIVLKGDEYLIQNHVVSYVGSATLWQTQNELEYNRKVKWIGFAPSYEEWNSFATSQAEIETITELMNGVSVKGKEASVKYFKKVASEYSIIHLANHAKINNDDPMYNTLLFAKDSVNNELTASEIYNLSIPSELVVLGACDTGFGKLEKGEGVMSLSRAFHYAGVKSTIMSLWKVPDKETSILMQSFYKYVKKGMTKTSALQQAKLQYINNTTDNVLKHPYYWAGFIISGNTDAMQPSVSYWWILSTLFFVSLIVFRKKLLKLFK